MDNGQTPPQSSGSAIEAPPAAATAAVSSSTAEETDVRSEAIRLQKQRIVRFLRAHEQRLKELYFLKNGPGALLTFDQWLETSDSGCAQFVDSNRVDREPAKPVDKPLVRTRPHKRKASTSQSQSSARPASKRSKLLPGPDQMRSGVAIVEQPTGHSIVITTKSKAVGTKGTRTTASTDESFQQAGHAKAALLHSPRVLEMAENEDRILKRIDELRKQGLWQDRMLPKVAEPARRKTHWDYLLDEMTWLSNDFRMERKWKIAMARKLAKAVQKWHEEKRREELRKLKAELNRKRKVAGVVAKEVQHFWKSMMKVVDYKHSLHLESVKQAALETHLDFLVGKTEQYTKQLLQGMQSDYVSVVEAARRRKQATATETDQPSNDQVTEKQERKAITSASASINTASAAMTPAAAQSIPSSSIKASFMAAPNADASSEPGAKVKASAPQSFDDLAPEDAEYNPAETDTNMDDDESTMKEEDEPDNPSEELNALEEEGNVPIEVLLRRYGYLDDETDQGADDNDDEDSKDESPGSGKLDKADEAEDEGSAQSAPRTRRGTRRATRRTQAQKRKRSASDDEGDSLREAEADSVNGEETEAAGAMDTTSEPETNVLHQLVSDDNEPVPGAIAPQTAEQLVRAASHLDQIRPRSATPEDEKINIKQPFLLKHPLRPYQLVGLNWLAAMSSRKLNGILADEMGLGKTIQTIALLAHIAIHRNNWGPHLIVVPSSVMLNWEMEIKKWCPAFKVLSYYGTQKERKEKRCGWNKPDTFHVCITSYRLAVQDAHVFKRKKWKFMILDEAHHIKNFESKRWQTLLRFNSKRRLLLTGTPLQNNLMELWSLLHFLMPNIFQSHQQFKEWFGVPMAQMVEGRRPTTAEAEQRDKRRVARLHKLLRPFILRRMKSEVETQLPSKHEHVVTCQLSKRQRRLYDEFMSRKKTKETIESGNYLSVMNILMQLRKVCNHPNLFAEPRIDSPFVMSGLDGLKCRLPRLVTASSGYLNTRGSGRDDIDLPLLNLNLVHNEKAGVSPVIPAPFDKIAALPLPVGFAAVAQSHMQASEHVEGLDVANVPFLATLAAQRALSQKDLLQSIAAVNEMRCAQRGLYGMDLRRCVSIQRCQRMPSLPRLLDRTSLVASFSDRCDLMRPIVTRFTICVPRVLAPPPRLDASAHIQQLPALPPLPAESRTALDLDPSKLFSFFGVRPDAKTEKAIDAAKGRRADVPVIVQQSRALARAAASFQLLAFPDRKRVQYDCGKLQTLDALLRKLKEGKHRCLIFTQMSKMLDVLEKFLSYHHHTYLRMDGATPIKDRQRLLDRFNDDPRIFCFILSTRSAGLGVNLTGADTVVFYDSDWNPTIDAQAQDRCHRIGQTRDVHIYRLVTEKTVEENILKKAQQKKRLGQLAIESGGFTAEFFRDTSLKDIFDSTRTANAVAEPASDTDGVTPEELSRVDEKQKAVTTSDRELEKAMLQAEDDEDRDAAVALEKEIDEQWTEFDTEVPFGEDGVDGTSADNDKQPSSESEQESAAHRLETQLSKLKGVEKHALHVLERYLSPVHRAQLQEADQAMREKDEQLRLMEDALRETEAQLDSDEEDMLFYEPEALEQLCQQYMEMSSASADEAGMSGLRSNGGKVASGTTGADVTTSSTNNANQTGQRAYSKANASSERFSQPFRKGARPGIYAAPQPDGVDDDLAIAVEPGLLSLYRVGLMTFDPPYPDLTRRRKRRKKVRDIKRHDAKQLQKEAQSKAGAKGADKAAVPDSGTDKKSKKAAVLGKGGKRKDKAADAAIAQGRGAKASIFRKKEDSRTAKTNARPPRHPRRLFKASSSSKDKKDVDSNKDAPPWLIEEDWALLQAVKHLLSPSGNVNWYLVAETVNMATSYTGRYRSRQQCRDRYFSTIMPREEGKLTGSAAKASSSATKGSAGTPKTGASKNANNTAKSASAGTKAKDDKKGKKKKPPSKTEAAKQAPPVKSTQTLLEQDKCGSLTAFHRKAFTQVVKLSQSRKDPKFKKTDGRTSQNQLFASHKINREKLSTAKVLADRRLEKLKQDFEARLKRRQQQLLHTQQQQAQFSQQVQAQQQAMALQNPSGFSAQPQVRPGASGSTAPSPSSRLSAAHLAAASRTPSIGVSASTSSPSQLRPSSVARGTASASTSALAARAASRPSALRTTPSTPSSSTSAASSAYTPAGITSSTSSGATGSPAATQLRMQQVMVHLMSSQSPIVQQNAKAIYDDSKKTDSQKLEQMLNLSRRLTTPPTMASRPVTTSATISRSPVTTGTSAITGMRPPASSTPTSYAAVSSASSSMPPTSIVRSAPNTSTASTSYRPPTPFHSTSTPSRPPYSAPSSMSSINSRYRSPVGQPSTTPSSTASHPLLRPSGPLSTASPTYAASRSSVPTLGTRPPTSSVATSAMSVRPTAMTSTSSTRPPVSMSTVPSTSAVISTSMRPPTTPTTTATTSSLSSTSNPSQAKGPGTNPGQP